MREGEKERERERDVFSEDLCVCFVLKSVRQMPQLRKESGYVSPGTV